MLDGPKGITSKALKDSEEAALIVSQFTLAAITNKGKLQAREGETSLFITPGYKFKVVDILLTNFHLPCSTLFMLVSAFIGNEKALMAYSHAINEEYRFYSYGDASLLFRSS